jgi:D-alanyl-D-alanine carboxypeptidase
MRVYAAILALVLFVRPGSAQQNAEAQLQHLISFLNAGDSTKIAEFATRAYHIDYLNSSGGVPRAVRRWLEIHSVYGPIAIDTVIDRAPRRVRAWTRGTMSKAWLDWHLELDSATGKITRVGLGRGVRPGHAALRHPVLKPDELQRDLRQHVAAMASHDLFSGVVAVQHRGHTVLSEAIGFADREAGMRNQLNTRFDLASVGKIFTAVAIAQLVESGRLSFSDTLARFQLLPRLARPITIKQLLSHTSGLGELGPALDAQMAQARNVSQMIELLNDTTVAFPPGTNIQYSNRGFVLLGGVIEALSGNDYFSFIETNVFARAGMTNSGFFANDSLVSNRARPYSWFPTLRSSFTPGPRRLTQARHDVRGSPAGGAYSTALDLLRFAEAFLDGRLVSKTMVNTMTQPSGDSPFSYGIELTPGGFGHRGGAPGATSYFFVFPEAGYTVVVLSNYDAAASIVGDYIRERIGL